YRPPVVSASPSYQPAQHWQYSEEPGNHRVNVSSPIGPGNGPQTSPLMQSQSNPYTLNRGPEHAGSGTVPTSPHMPINAPGDSVPADWRGGPHVPTVEDAQGDRDQDQFQAGPNDRRFSSVQERQFLRLYQRNPGLAIKEYLRLMGVGNGYAKHAGFI